MDVFYKLKPHLFSILFVVFFCSCFKNKPQVSRSYYFWRTENITWEERKFLKQHQINKLYARLLDVDWSEVYGPVPVASNELGDMSNDLLENDSLRANIVPVVFITNKTFTQIDTAAIPLLAKRLVRRCLPAYDSIDIGYERNHYIYNNGRTFTPSEIQFDCDWTSNTAQKYFRFLKEVKKLLPSDSIMVSATIRLHQYKYPSKTGIPPVDRGMLMVYNISDPKQYGPVNSIFDYKKAKEYFTSGKKYPLPLDIALPAWSWCLVFRNHKFYQIENELAEGDLKQLSFLQPKGNGWYAVTKDTVYRELYLRPGDELKAEGIDDKTLQQVAQLAQKAINTDSFSLALFELSEKEIKNYNSETINQVYTSMH